MSAPTLTYRREFGAHVATAPFGGEADALAVRIARNGAGWHIAIATHGRPLAAEWQPRLADARTWAQRVVDSVWVDA